MGDSVCFARLAIFIRGSFLTLQIVVGSVAPDGAKRNPGFEGVSRFPPRYTSRSPFPRIALRSIRATGQRSLVSRETAYADRAVFPRASRHNYAAKIPTPAGVTPPSQ